MRFGPVLMSKELVSTRAPVAKVPKYLQESMLLPDFVIRYEATSPEVEVILKEVVGNSLSSKISLMQQIRILMQHLDPKMRMQPVTIVASDETGVFRYALS